MLRGKARWQSTASPQRGGPPTPPWGLLGRGMQAARGGAAYEGAEWQCIQQGKGVIGLSGVRLRCGLLVVGHQR